MFKIHAESVTFDVRGVGQITIQSEQDEVTEANFVVTNAKGKNLKEINGILEQACRTVIKERGYSLRPTAFNVMFE